MELSLKRATALGVAQTRLSEGRSKKWEPDLYLLSVQVVCGQNANRTKCQPDIMPTKGWHFVRTFFCGWHFVRPNFLVGILSGPSQHVFAFCRNHENHIS